MEFSLVQGEKRPALGLPLMNLSNPDNACYILYHNTKITAVHAVLLYLVIDVADGLFIFPRFPEDIWTELLKRTEINEAHTFILKTAERTNSFKDFVEQVNSDQRFSVIVLNEKPVSEIFEYLERDDIRSLENIRFTKYVKKFIDFNAVNVYDVKAEIDREFQDLLNFLIGDVINPQEYEIQPTEIDNVEARRYKRKGVSARVKKPVVPVKILVRHPKTGTLFYRTYYVAKNKLDYYRRIEEYDVARGSDKPRYLTTADEIDLNFNHPTFSMKAERIGEQFASMIRQDNIPKDSAVMSGTVYYIRDRFSQVLGQKSFQNVIGVSKKTYFNERDSLIRSDYTFTDKRNRQELIKLKSVAQFKEREKDGSVDFVYKYNIKGILNTKQLRDFLLSGETKGLKGIEKDITISGNIRQYLNNEEGIASTHMYINRITSKKGNISMKELAYMILVNRNIADLIHVNINGVSPQLRAKLLAMGFTIADNNKTLPKLKEIVENKLKRWKEIVDEYRKKNNSDLTTELTDDDIGKIKNALKKAKKGMKEFQLYLLREGFDKFYLLFEELGVLNDYMKVVNEYRQKRIEGEIKNKGRMPKYEEVPTLTFTSYNRTIYTKEYKEYLEGKRKKPPEPEMTTSEKILASWLISTDPQNEYFLGWWVNQRLKYTKIT